MSFLQVSLSLHLLFGFPQCVRNALDALDVALFTQRLHSLVAFPPDGLRILFKRHPGDAPLLRTQKVSKRTQMSASVNSFDCDFSVYLNEHVQDLGRLSAKSEQAQPVLLETRVQIIQTLQGKRHPGVGSRARS